MDCSWSSVTDAQALMLVILLAPMAIVLVIGMLKGYHIFIHIYKGSKHPQRTDDHGQPGS